MHPVQRRTGRRSQAGHRFQNDKILGAVKRGDAFPKDRIQAACYIQRSFSFADGILIGAVPSQLFDQMQLFDVSRDSGLGGFHASLP